jgi:hypothetical protein
LLQRDWPVLQDLTDDLLRGVDSAHAGTVKAAQV